MEKGNKIKTVQSVREPRKKLYMLYSTEPHRSITGGTWYSDTDFDAEFVNLIYTKCLEFVAARVCVCASVCSVSLSPRVLLLSLRGGGGGG